MDNNRSNQQQSTNFALLGGMDTNGHQPTPATMNQQQVMIAPQLQATQVPLLPPQPLMTGGSRKDCIRLRGLPYEAQVEQILEFLLDSAKNIVFQGVHMVYNAQVNIPFLLITFSY